MDRQEGCLQQGRRTVGAVWVRGPWSSGRYPFAKLSLFDKGLKTKQDAKGRKALEQMAKDIKTLSASVARAAQKYWENAYNVHAKAEGALRIALVEAKAALTQMKSTVIGHSASTEYNATEAEYKRLEVIGRRH
jgi:hypothetical protein